MYGFACVNILGNQSIMHYCRNRAVSA